MTVGLGRSPGSEAADPASYLQSLRATPNLPAIWVTFCFPDTPGRAGPTVHISSRMAWNALHPHQLQSPVSSTVEPTPGVMGNQQRAPDYASSVSAVGDVCEHHLTCLTGF